MARIAFADIRRSRGTITRRPRIAPKYAAGRSGVDTDQVGGAEGRRFGAGGGRAGDDVNLFDGHAHGLHVLNALVNGIDADAIGYEIGRILGVDNTLAEPAADKLGQPCNHGYFTGRADVGKNRSGVPFGFEVIQPTYGPSHYKEDFLQVLGPGIHHVDLAPSKQSVVQ